jgi:hypothetical protein
VGVVKRWAKKWPFRPPGITTMPSTDKLGAFFVGRWFAVGRKNDPRGAYTRYAFRGLNTKIIKNLVWVMSFDL